MTAPSPRPAARARLFARARSPRLAGGGGAAGRDGRRAAAHRRRGRRAGLGELARGPQQYADLRDLAVGPAALHLDLSLGTWAADGLLAIFFFVAGLELKREFVAGDLRDPRRAALPGRRRGRRDGGPAAVYVAFNAGGERSADRLGDPDRHRHRLRRGRPGRDQHPPADRAAHVPAHPRRRRRPARDHVIALFYTDELDPTFLLLALLPLGAFAVLVQRRIRAAVAAAAAGAAHLGAGARVRACTRPWRASLLGVHGAGTAGVAPAPAAGLAEHLEHRCGPISAGVAVPVFAFFAAGVTVGGLEWPG